jgi:hypothetical protein
LKNDDYTKFTQRDLFAEPQLAQFRLRYVPNPTLQLVYRLRGRLLRVGTVAVLHVAVLDQIGSHRLIGDEIFLELVYVDAVAF